jgi:hypothetical protein
MNGTLMFDLSPHKDRSNIEQLLAGFDLLELAYYANRACETVVCENWIFDVRAGFFLSVPSEIHKS